MKIKKLLVLLLTVAMVVTLLVMPASAASLSDLGNHWAKDSIDRWVDSGVIGGYPDGTFKPDGSITRAEFATILAKAFGLSGKGDKVFSDVDAHWAKDYIYACAASGIVGGYPDGSFLPDKAITRQEAMKMFVGAMDFTFAFKEGSDATYEDFLKDWFLDGDQVQEWAQYYAAAMVAHGAMQGSKQGDGWILRPTANISRAEVAVILDRVLAGYVGAQNQISTTTLAQEELMGSRIVVHPSASVDVIGYGTGYVELINDTDSESIYREENAFYLLCGDFESWIYFDRVDFNEGQPSYYSMRTFESKRSQSYTQINEDGSESRSESVTEFFYNEETWDLEKVLTYQDGELTNTIYAEMNEDGTPAKIICNDVVRKEYEYNEAGLVTAEIYYYEDGSLEYMNEYTYDENGRIAEDKYTYVNWWNEPVYDEDGNIVGEEQVANEYFYITKHTYDEDGNRVSSKEYTEDEFLINEWGYTYDENGEITQEIYLNYDWYYDENDERVFYESYREEVTYENGNVSERFWHNTNSDGEVISYAKEVFSYDENGREIELACYGLDGLIETIYTTYYDDTWRETSHYTVNAEGVETWKYTYEWSEEDTYGIEKQSYYELGELRWTEEYKNDYMSGESVGTKKDAEGNIISEKYSIGREVEGMWHDHSEHTSVVDNNFNVYDTYYYQILLPEDYENITWEYYHYIY